MNQKFLTATVTLDYPTANQEAPEYTVRDVENGDFMDQVMSGRGFIWLEDGDDLVLVRATRVREVRIHGGVLR